MKRKEYDLICQDSWSLICEYGIDIRIKVSQLTKEHYIKYGGFVNILNYAVKYNDKETIQYSHRRSMSIETLLHPFRCSLLNSNTLYIQTAIQDILKKYHLLQEYFKSDQIYNWMNDGLLIAGGFVRSIVLQALHLANIKIPHIDYSCKDVDIFIDRTLINNNDLQASQIVGHLYEDIDGPRPNDFYDKFFGHHRLDVKVENIPPPNKLIYNLAVQVIFPGTNLMNILKKKSFKQIIEGFDLTCTQACFTGWEWWIHGNVHVTPGFLYSCFTGRMFYTHNQKTKWPITTLESDRLPSGRFCFPGSLKENMINRFFKYIVLGYHDPTLSNKEYQNLKILYQNGDFEYNAEYRPNYEDYFANL